MNTFTACLTLQTSSSPLIRTAASMCHSYNLECCVGNSINHRVGKSAQKIFPGVVRVLRPARRTVADDTDGVVQSRHESSGGRRVALGISIVSRLGLGDSAGVKSNAW